MEVPERPENTSEGCDLSSQVGEIRRLTGEAQGATISAPIIRNECTSLALDGTDLHECLRSLFTDHLVLVSLGDVPQHGRSVLVS